MVTLQPLENINIGGVCRACFETCEQYKMLFEDAENAEKRSLGDVFFDVVKIEKAEIESSPSRICLPCSKDLISAYKFIQKSQENNERFMMYLRNSIIKQSDCLSEFPIDIPDNPNIADFLQIKVENEAISEYAGPLLDDKNSPSSSSESVESDDDASSLYVKEKINKMQCTYCNRIFKRLDFLENHKKKHEEEMKKKEDEFTEGSSVFLCDECGISCSSKLELKTHRTTNHTTSKKSPKEEKPRNQKITTRSQSRKIKTPTGRFECDSCNKTFAWKKDLFRHERYHEPNTKKFPCPHCERRFIRKDKLSSHLLVHLTGIAKSRLTTTQFFAHNILSEKKFRELKCMICNFDKATSVRELRQHISFHNNLEFMEDLKDSEVVKKFYPKKDLNEIIPLIYKQIEMNQLGKLHSIVNAFGYEMGISDSDESDPEKKTQYTCEICQESFNRKHKLMTHQSYEHTVDQCPYKCEGCKLRFTCQRVLESHLKHHCENPDKKFLCKKCPGRFTWPNNFKNHVCGKIKPIKEIHTCEVCDKNFDSPRDLRIHKKTHIPIGMSHDCDVCGEKFLRLDNLRWHLKLHAKKDRLPAKKIMCMLCPAEFSSISGLKQHLVLHSDGQTDVNFKSCGFVNNFYPDAEETTISESIRSCFKEQKLWQLYLAVNKFGHEVVLSDSDSGDEQQPKVDPSETYICELCDVKFPRMQDIRKHQYVEHDPEVTSFPHKCGECSDQFVCEALLNRHSKSECLNSHRTNACTKCGIKFIWKQNLAIHYCGNSSKDDKKCEVCGKKFSWLKDLHRHKRNHIPDEKKFECLVCGKKFNRKDNMRAHMKIHDAEAKKLKDKDVLKWEQQDENVCRPHGEKTIFCKICSTKHNSIRDLTSHLLTHKDRSGLKLKESEVRELSVRFFNRQMEMRSFSKALCKAITSGKHSRFYSIANEVGYELSLIDSETGSDMDGNDDDDDDGVMSKGYKCKLCEKNFDRKFKIFEHQTRDHSWEELPFECSYCSAKFVCESLYNAHLQYQCENNEKHFKCKLCPMKFMWKDNLRTHQRLAHDKHPTYAKKHECNSCDKSFLWLKDLSRHKKIHQLEEEKFECTWCFRVFLRRDNLKVHMKVHQNANHLLLPDIYYLARPNGVKVAECKHCDQKYSTVYELMEHIQNSHSKYKTVLKTPEPTSYSIRNALGYEMDIEDSETEKEEPIEKYICEICSAQFNRRFKLLQHQQSVHYSDNIPHKCPHCDFKCVSKFVLAYHMRTQCMNEEKKYRCSKCTMRFMWPENLENHESLIHDGPRTYTCEICKKNFATEHDLKNHADCKPPTEVKLFECELCDRKYNRKDRLMRHIKVHRSDQPKRTQSTDKKFLCAFCGKEVSSSSNLVIHMRRHTGEKPFKCEFCNKGFPRSSDLSCHRRTHTGERPHKCTVCEKAFSRSYKLQTHMRIHSGERPYKCTYCEKSFTQSNDLTLHVRRHTGERPYICQVCGERFIQGTALRNHRRMRGHYEI